MTTPDTDGLLTILQDAFDPREDGWLWLALYQDEREGGVVQQVEGAYADPAATAHGLAHVINGCGADHAYLALCRAEGRPTQTDRQLWRELRRLVDAELLTDMVVFDRHQAWSMRADGAAAA